MADKPTLSTSCRNCKRSRGTSLGELICLERASPAYAPDSIRGFASLHGVVARASKSTAENLRDDRRCQELAEICPYFERENHP